MVFIIEQLHLALNNPQLPVKCDIQNLNLIQFHKPEPL